MSEQTPKIAQDIRRLRRDIEFVVQRMNRLHKYESGKILRRRILAVQSLVVKAWRDPDQIALWLEQLTHEVDMLKEDMQFAQDIRAYQSFGQFQHLYRQAFEIGRQAGGWFKRHKHPIAQNAGALPGGSQRGEILSTHATPAGAINV